MESSDEIAKVAMDHHPNTDKALREIAEPILMNVVRRVDLMHLTACSDSDSDQEDDPTSEETDEQVEKERALVRKILEKDWPRCLMSMALRCQPHEDADYVKAHFYSDVDSTLPQLMEEVMMDEAEALNRKEKLTGLLMWMRYLLDQISNLREEKLDMPEPKNFEDEQELAKLEKKLADMVALRSKLRLKMVDLIDAFLW